MKPSIGARIPRLRTAVLLTLAVCVVTTLPAATLAQDDPIEPDPQQQRQREQAMEQLRVGIDNMEGLDAGERTRMHNRLRSCSDAGLAPEQLEGLFPTQDQRHLQARTAVRVQNRVTAALADGLPVEPMVAKVREGCVKGVPDTRIEQAAQRIEANLRVARRVMHESVGDGLTPPADRQQQANQVRTMAQHMWSGLQEGDMQRLRERARERLRDGSCQTDDLVGASGAAVRMMDVGADRAEAVRLSGEALRRGYSRQQMQEMSALLAAGHANGGPLDSMLRDLKECLGEGMDCGEMARHMVRAGWLGPGQMQGPGGHGSGMQHGAGNPGYQGGHGGMEGGGMHGGDTEGDGMHGGSGGGNGG